MAGFVYSSSLFRIWNKDLGLKASFKVQLTQEHKPADHQHHRVIADWVPVMHKIDPHFYQKIVLTDDTPLNLDVYVNKQTGAFGARKTQDLLLRRPLQFSTCNCMVKFMVGYEKVGDTNKLNVIDTK